MSSSADDCQNNAAENTHTKVVNRAEALFLIYKMLQSMDGFEDVTQCLQQTVAAGGKLGTSIGWDGSERPYSLIDFDVKYPHVTSSQLEKHLQRSVQLAANSSGSSVQSFNGIKRSSMLLPIVFRAENEQQDRRFTELSFKLGDLLSRIRINRRNHSTYQRRLLYLNHSLGTTMNEYSVELPYDDKNMKRANMNGAVIEILDSDEENTMPRNSSDGSNVLPVLKQVGQSKEIPFVQGKLKHNDDCQSLLRVELETVKTELEQLGCLAHGLQRGSVDCSINWLRSREMGLMKSSLVTSFTTSYVGIKNELRLNYSKLWTISGHMGNPAYNCIFDQTCQYIISGADDYLVKIWHADSGRLIRTCKGHVGYIAHVAISPDNSIIASACTLGTIRIWRLSDGVCLQVFKHQTSVNWIKFDPTSCALASGSDDGQCIIWDLSKLLHKESCSVPLLDILHRRYRTDFHKVKNANDVTNSTGSIVHDMSSTNQLSSGVDPAIPLPPLPQPPSSSVPLPGGENQQNAVHLRSNNEDILENISRTAAYAPISARESRGGVFEWSRPSTYSNGIDSNEERNCQSMLILPHFWDKFLDESRANMKRNMNNASMHGTSSAAPFNQNLVKHDELEVLKVNCLDIHPLGHLIATGSDDGVSRLWLYCDSIASLFNEEEFCGDANIGSRSMGSTEENRSTKKFHRILASSAEDKAKIGRASRYQLLRLTGHVSPVTDIHFNPQGTRLLTGCGQDCNVRIWTFNENFTRAKCVILNLIERECGNSSQLPKSRRRSQGTERQKPQLYNACWTVDGTRIVTTQNVISQKSTSQTPMTSGKKNQPTRLKVWDAVTGDLLRVIGNISNMCCRILVKHPLDSNVVLTAGEDGFVNIWDLDRERLVKRITITHPSSADPAHRNTPVHLQQANACGTPIPSHIGDANFSEDGTRIAVTDVIGRVTFIGLDKPQRFQNIFQEQYFSTDYSSIIHDETGFAIDEQTQLPVHEAPQGSLCNINQVAYDAPPSQWTGPPQLPVSEVERYLADIAVRRKELRQSMMNAYTTIQRNEIKGRKPRGYVGGSNVIAGGDKLNSKLSPAPNQSHSSKKTSVPFARNSAERPSRVMTINDLSSSRNSSERKHRQVKYLEFDELEEFSEVDNINDSDYDEVHYLNDSDEEDELKDSSPEASGMRRSSRNRNRMRLSYKEDDDEEGVDGMVRNLRASSSRRSGGNNQDSRDLYYRHNFKDSKRAARLARRSRERRKTISMLISSDEEEENEDSQQLNSRLQQVRQQKRQDTNRKPSRGRKVQSYHRFNEIRASGISFERSWLQNDTLLDHQYAPQLGDSVIYLPQGHVEYLNYFTEQTSPPWNQFARKVALIQCTVQKVEYSFPEGQLDFDRCPSVIATVTLKPLKIPSVCRILPTGHFELKWNDISTSSYSPFTVALRDCTLPEFLVPTDLFERSIELSWHQGIRVHVHYKTDDFKFEKYTGRVMCLKASDEDWPHSPWESLQIKWDDSDETGPVHPWEAIPDYDSSSEYSRVVKRFPMNRIPIEECERISSKINEFIDQNSDMIQPFMYEVDSHLYPNYYREIPVLMYIDLIQRRLKNAYYRQKQALKHDVKLIEQNCITFNCDDSPLTADARFVTQHLLNIINLECGEDEEEDDEMIEADIPPSLATNNHSSTASNSKSRIDSTGSLMLRISRGSKQKDDSLLALGNASHDAGICEEDTSPMLRLKRRRHSSSDDDDFDCDSENSASSDDCGNDDDSNSEDVWQKRQRRTSRVTSGDRRHKKLRRLNRNDSNSKGNCRSSLRRIAAKDDEELQSTRSNRKIKKPVSYYDDQAHDEEIKRSKRKQEDLQRRRKVDDDDEFVVEHQPQTRRIDPELRDRMLAIVRQASDFDEFCIFAEPVDEPGYKEVIKHPIDLSTIRTNVNRRMYQSVQEVVLHVLLMYSNCEQFNVESSAIYKNCLRQRSQFISYLETCAEDFSEESLRAAASRLGTDDSFADISPSSSYHFQPRASGRTRGSRDADVHQEDDVAVRQTTRSCRTVRKPTNFYDEQAHIKEEEEMKNAEKRAKRKQEEARLKEIEQERRKKRELERKVRKEEEDTINAEIEAKRLQQQPRRIDPALKRRMHSIINETESFDKESGLFSSLIQSPVGIDLNTLRSNVTMGRYSNLLDFYGDILEVFDTVINSKHLIDKPEVRRQYVQQRKEYEHQMNCID